ncbi:hypothetical protein NLG97_g5000 [Lecanicillium saksenae]|uniref:Uncharacterized protein n=1 Tax=Lecanicillium saksenae TaxID=468837 RepID=A0ACC1QU81_9HYPO|nr:hypothetical protein NLG97_g5000 [Lecanicillium saksenae]
MEHAAPSNAQRGRTLTWHEATDWQRNSKYILRGYRTPKADCREILTSLTFLHNETCNVYTHLIGAILLPVIAALIMRGFLYSQFFFASGMDYAMFGIFFWCTECCLLLSTAFHLLASRSREVVNFWCRMDLVSIVIFTMGSIVPGIYYIYFCESYWRRIHWVVAITSGFSTSALLSLPVFSTILWRRIRIGAFVVLGASALIPLIHGSHRYGLNGSTIHLLQIPERFAPGRFDIWGSSHQIFHVAILCAIAVHTVGLIQAFTACHTMDICSIQAAQKADQRA